MRRARGLALADEALAGSKGALPAEGSRMGEADVGRSQVSMLGTDAGGPAARAMAVLRMQVRNRLVSILCCRMSKRPILM